MSEPPPRVRVRAPAAGRPRRTTVSHEIDAQSALGEVYMRSLVRSQLRLALGLLTVLWFIYPIVWAVGTEGAGAVGLSTEIAIFAVIDLAAKVGFGLMLVTGASRLHSPATERTLA